MLKKLRYRFIASAMLAFFAVILLIAVLVNVGNYIVVTRRMDQTIGYIMDFESGRPEMPMPGNREEQKEQDGQPLPGDQEGPRDMPFMALPDVEANYMTRFFIVRYERSGDLKYVYTDYIASVDGANAEEYGEKVLNGDRERGFINEYRFNRKEIGGTTVIVFLNVMSELRSVKSLLLMTLAMSFGSLILVFILVYVFSRKAIKPITDNIERQKTFITDASHELKTPLTSISTSLDVLAMEHGEDEWTENIRSQTGRMSKLVSELVILSRLDEETPLPNKETFSLSTSAWEIAEVYKPQAKAVEKNMDVEIEDNIEMFGDRQAVGQMLSVLLDNAIRYSDEKGDIRFSLFRKKGKINIEVFNTCVFDEVPDTDRLFDRFYRPDSSRSKETGGTGVGLAIAKAVAESHGGTISASCPSGKTMTIRVVF